MIKGIHYRHVLWAKGRLVAEVRKHYMPESTSNPRTSDVRRPWRWAIILLCAFLIGGIVSWFGYRQLISGFYGQDRFSTVGEFTIVRAIGLYVFMVIGMLARGLHDYIQRCSSINIIMATRRVMNSTAFLMAIIVSPIVFFAIYNSTAQVPDNIVALLLSFQNGFFWQTVLEKSEAAKI